MRVYGFGEGLMAKATQPRLPSKDEQIAQLRAENERLKEALRDIKDRCNRGATPMGIMAACDAALGKGAA